MPKILFDEPTKLYAEHAALVDAMRGAFKTGVGAFLEQIRHEAAALLPEPLQQHDTGAYRYWWTAPTDAEKDSCAHLWFATNEPEIIAPGRIALTVVSPKADAATLARLADVARLPELREWCKPVRKVGSWSIFTATLTYAEGDEVGPLAEKLAALLMAMRTVETATQA